MSKGMRACRRVSTLDFFSFHHQLIFFLAVIPLLLEDSREMMEHWGSLGQLDPFENVYEVSTTA